LQSYKINFPVAIAEPQPLIPTITTTQFTFNSQTCSIRNQNNSFKLQVVSVDGTIEVDNVGSYNSTSGIVDIIGFKPTAYEGNAITLTVVPANQSTIRPLRNYVIDIDTALSSSRAVLDFQNTSVSI
jgi:Flp pilus assembly protein TadG